MDVATSSFTSSGDFYAAWCAMKLRVTTSILDNVNFMIFLYRPVLMYFESR